MSKDGMSKKTLYKVKYYIKFSSWKIEADMTKTESKGYRQRTQWNARDNDATLIISLETHLTGGSKFTYEYARRIAKPCLHVHPNSKWHE